MLAPWPAMPSRFLAIELFLPSVVAQDKVGFAMGIYLRIGSIGAALGAITSVFLALKLTRCNRLKDAASVSRTTPPIGSG
ncbi:MAG: hypothetical protein K8F25_04880 [Fimbriimonadaceae bacterium]|nr:hypothetical protein [Alphaproteobacteria bacterium]